ncbi:hypothetical protein [Klebsiella oxytoca]|nr:hypothetical protein [Klebsiella oxytoca]
MEGKNTAVLILAGVFFVIGFGIIVIAQETPSDLGVTAALSPFLSLTPFSIGGLGIGLIADLIGSGTIDGFWISTGLTALSVLSGFILKTRNE